MKSFFSKWLFVGLIFTFIACIKNSDYIINQNLNPDSIIQIASIVPNTALADSASVITIRIKINANTDSAENVTLTTNSGIINGKSVSETMSVNVNRYADFTLKSGQTAGPVFLRAMVLGSYFRDSVISFTMAYPDTIIIRPESYVVSTSSSLNATISFLRNQGYPSKDQTFLLSSLDSTGNLMGQYTYSGNFSPGSSLNSVFTPQAGYLGKATLQVVLIRKDGTRIIGKVQVMIQ